jgi:hypothetical protein
MIQSQVSLLYIVGEVLEYKSHLVATVVLNEPEWQVSLL